MEFARAYEINGRSDYNYALRNCIYQIHGREFKDLSFTEGETQGVFEGSTNEDYFAIRQYPDGKNFIFHYYKIPTFDAEDCDWDGKGYVVIFRDDEGLNLISCRCGYYLSTISIYIGMIIQEAEFQELLESCFC